MKKIVLFTAAKQLRTKFPDMSVLTSEIHPVAPNHFGQKYFGTEWNSFEISKDSNFLFDTVEKHLFCQKMLKILTT